MVAAFGDTIYRSNKKFVYANNRYSLIGDHMRRVVYNHPEDTEKLLKKETTTIKKNKKKKKHSLMFLFTERSPGICWLPVCFSAYHLLQN